jgi:hypothetical protein
MIGLNTSNGDVIYYSAEKLGMMEKESCVFVDKDGESKEAGPLRSFKQLHKMGGYSLDRARFDELVNEYLNFRVDERIATEMGLKGNTYRRFYY